MLFVTTTFLLLFFLLWLVFLALEPVIEHLIKRAAHRTAAFRYRDYLPVAVLLGAGIAVTFYAGDWFIDIAERVRADSPQLREIDERTHEWARFTRTAGSTRFFNTMTIIGTPVGLAAIVLIASIVLFAKKHWRWASYLIFTTGVGGLLNRLLKSSFERARPDLAEALRQASGFSFPSGHAMGSVVCFGALSYLAMRAIPRWRWRAAALAFGLTMALSIASSRIYLGVHWISDIGAGMCAGLIWVSVTTVAYETFRRIRMIRALRRVSS
ncbi:MAG TPA: phosphatase PAP2 family protein [Thermoanaerobaculia bacterium]|nr:phosphatase PAP2 family protein [Thermoanaerobaculia bacterium]